MMAHSFSNDSYVILDGKFSKIDPFMEHESHLRELILFLIKCGMSLDEICAFLRREAKLDVSKSQVKALIDAPDSDPDSDPGNDGEGGSSPSP